ncbi:MAG: AEC family transporter [Myxococcota bacterium]
MEVVFGTIVPVFAVVAVGWWLAGRPVDAATLSELALWVTSPALLFSLLSGTGLDAARMADLAGGTLAIVAGTALAAAAYVRASDVGRGFLLPAVFFNGGNMGLACSRLAFGADGLEAAAVPFVVIATFTSLFGIWIAKGENGLGEALRIPMIWGAVGGLALAVTGVTLPRMVMEPIEMLGAMAVPLMLLNLGIQLRGLKVSDVHHSLVAVGVRMGGGFAVALAFTTLLGVQGVDRGVLLLMGVMPAAVVNAVIAERYQTDTGLVASAIVIGTLASLLTIPAVLLLVAAP